MMRCLLALLLALGLSAAETAAPARGAVPAAGEVDRYVALFNPEFTALDERGRPVHAMRATPILDLDGSGSASDIAQEVRHNTWFTILVFLPFLVLPQVLLLVVIYRFRDRKDGRKAATFSHNTRLELIWTAIPILALIIVCVPATRILVKMETPPLTPEARQDPSQCTVLTVYGRQFFWEYRYNHEGIELGLDAAQIQEPVILAKDRVAEFHVTSKDVNHAWWVPALGIKKDAIPGRATYTWCRPTHTGVFKGQCAELCGRDHGLMVVFAVVVEQEEFDLWVRLQRVRADAAKVVAALTDREAGDAALAAVLDGYLAKHGDAFGRFALRYWAASTFASLTRRPQPGLTTADYHTRVVAPRRERLDALLAAAPAL